jgi:ankyrin repeat protein
MQNSQDDDGATPLSLAAKWQNAEVAAVLLNHPGIQVNLSDDDGVTPLMAAAKSGPPDCQGPSQVVSLLLNKPEIQVHLRDDNGMSALTYAASEGHDGVVGPLLERSEGKEPTGEHIQEALRLARESLRKASLPWSKSRFERVQQLLVSRLRRDEAAKERGAEQALGDRIEDSGLNDLSRFNDLGIEYAGSAGLTES